LPDGYRPALGNMPTEKLLSYFTAAKDDSNLHAMSFESAYNEATKLFSGIPLNH
jgi:hydroxymethylglutaryl-CoA lyase